MKPTLFIAAAVLCIYPLLEGQQGETGVAPAKAVYTNAQADRGEDLYPVQCDRCHGMYLEGDEAPSLKGPEFLADWKGKTLGDLYDRIRIWMPGNEPGSLTDRQSADLLAFLLRENGYPAGKTELPPSAAPLRKIPVELK